MQVDWTHVRYFRASEFDSPDQPGLAKGGMQNAIVMALDRIRARGGFPIIISSGYRTPAHNAEVGGVDGSAHIRGYAADLAIRSSRQRSIVVRLAYEEGIRRVGVGAHIIHLDMDPSLVADVMWLY